MLRQGFIEFRPASAEDLWESLDAVDPGVAWGWPKVRIERLWLVSVGFGAEIWSNQLEVARVGPNSSRYGPVRAELFPDWSDWALRRLSSELGAWPAAGRKRYFFAEGPDLRTTAVDSLVGRLFPMESSP